MRNKQPATEKPVKPEDSVSPPIKPVKLKPLFGIRPGVWLTVLYSIILLVLVFFLLVRPGLVNPRAVLVLVTEPDGAALRVNGVFMGTSRDRIILPRGTHTLEAVLPGFESQSAVHEIPSRVFASRFFPRRYRVEFTLKSADPAAAFALAAADFAEWTFGGEPSTVWQIPLSLSEGAYRLGPAKDPQAADILTAAARFTVTRAALRDLVRAKFLLDNAGLSPSPPAALGSVSDILVFLSENPGSARWLAGLLPPESAAILRASDWYKNDSPAVVASPSLASPFPDGGARELRSFELAGLVFSRPDQTSRFFLMSETPVSVTLYEEFLSENPQWRGENRSELFTDIHPGPEVTGVSWYAAEAFCQWLTARLPWQMVMSGFEVRLPTEAEWEYAFAAGMNMGTTAWEWCADPFAPLTFITACPMAVQAVGSPERLLRSRSLNPAVDPRASLPPDFLSPFVTFRPVIAVR